VRGLQSLKDIELGLLREREKEIDPSPRQGRESELALSKETEHGLENVSHQ
jgi:hypothetical protein